MDQQLELLAKVETYIGAVFVAFYGFERFRKPPSEPGAREALVLGLRRIAGVECHPFAARFGVSVEELGGQALRRHLDWRLLEYAADHLRLTREGLFISDSLWGEYLRT